MKNQWAKWLCGKYSINPSRIYRIFTLCGLLAITALALGGCTKKPEAIMNNDPLEGYNRAMFAFNMDIDHLVFRPVAKAYETVTPPVLQKGVTNVFANIDEIPTFPNDFMQGNFRYMVIDLWRFVINSTAGVGGLFDIATRIGIKPHIETFGLTLAKWRGGQSAPYFVIPLFGPSTFQTAIGNAADYYMNFWSYLNDQDINYYAHGVKFLNLRAQLLPADKLVENAFDPYIFVRDAYLQTQQQKINENQALPKIPEAPTTKASPTH